MITKYKSFFVKNKFDLNKVNNIFSNILYPEKVIIKFIDFWNNLIEKRLDLVETVRERFINDENFALLLVSFLLHSDFYAIILKNYPHLIENFFDYDKSESYISNLYLNLKEKFLNFKNTADEILYDIKFFKINSFIRIILNDISNRLPLIEIVKMISLVADYSLELMFFYAYKKLVEATDNRFDFNYIRDNIAVVSLGKLGGMELNYSSDVDIIYICKDNIDYDNLSVLEKFCQYHIQGMEKKDSLPAIFRVDLRLRPNGEQGALLNKVSSYINYYYKYGQLWEKQALIKARYSAGNEELAKLFLDKISNLSYEPKQDIIFIEKIIDIKNKIEKNIENKVLQNFNIKLSSGGIRDIEFIVQSKQIQYGYEIPSLRVQNTIKALKLLGEKKIINTDFVNILLKNYSILRLIEHRLQIYNESHTYDINFQDEIIPIIAKDLNLFSTDLNKIRSEFMNFLFRITEQNRMIFLKLLVQTLDFFKKKINIYKAIGKGYQEILEKHFSKLEIGYFNFFSEEDIIKHVKMVSKIHSDNKVEVDCHRDDKFYIVDIVAFDFIGELSIVCGLISSYNFHIGSAVTFSYKWWGEEKKHLKPELMVGQFKLFSKEEISFPVARFEKDLNYFFEQFFRESDYKFDNTFFQEIFNLSSNTEHKMMPMDIVVDNDSDEHYTILKISSYDDFAFLFQLTRILSLRKIFIGKVEISTDGSYINDIFYLTDHRGNKIVDIGKIEDLKIILTLLKQFSQFLVFSPDYRMALENFNFLIDKILKEKGNDKLPILGNQKIMTDLARIFGTSYMTWEYFLKLHFEHLIPLFDNLDFLDIKKRKNDLIKQLKNRIPPEKKYDFDYIKKQINKFKDEELLRIDLRYILNKIGSFREFSRELSELAHVILQVVVEYIDNILEKKYGVLVNSIGEKVPAVILGLGKLGGRELGYASDIEIQFIYQSDGFTEGDTKINAAEYFNKFMEMLLSMIEARKDGIFELDLRLRPYGEDGSISISLNSFKLYYSLSGNADLWERQALIKSRVICGIGDYSNLEKELTFYINSYVYNEKIIPFSYIQTFRKKQIDNLKDKQRFNVKFGRGGLIDIEYIVQFLQIKYGHDYREIRDTNTLYAIEKLYLNQFIDKEQYYILKEGYSFYRNIINALRIVKGKSKAVYLPDYSTTDFKILSRRMYLLKCLNNDKSDYLKDKVEFFRKQVTKLVDDFLKDEN